MTCLEHNKNFTRTANGNLGPEMPRNLLTQLFTPWKTWEDFSTQNIFQSTPLNWQPRKVTSTMQSENIALEILQVKFKFVFVYLLLTFEVNNFWVYLFCSQGVKFRLTNSHCWTSRSWLRTSPDLWPWAAVRDTESPLVDWKTVKLIYQVKASYNQF